jgi:hypothetical protein
MTGNKVNTQIKLRAYPSNSEIPPAQKGGFLIFLLFFFFSSSSSLFFFFFCLFVCLRWGSHYVAQVGPELAI